MTFCAQSDLKQCVYLFRSQFERCGESEAADANRLAQAQRIYDALGTSNGTNGIDGNGQDLKKATRRQKDVVNAANTTKSPGQGWCAAWVTNVFQSAGIGYFGGNACDMCRAYCTIIEDFLREQCALYYPTAVEAECNGILTADFNANEYRVDFSLKDTEDQQLTGITVVYHLSTKQCELM